MGSSSFNWEDVTSGVPQGSVLGPLLFVIFINDMPQVVHHILKLFADDSNLMGLIRKQNDHHTMQSDLDALTKWAEDWKMVFHPDKCKLMVIDKDKQTWECLYHTT